MTDSLAFSELFLCWILANYGFCNDPVCEDGWAWPDRADLLSGWHVCVLARSLLAAALWWAAMSWSTLAAGPAVLLFCGSLLAPWIRRQCVPVRRLVEFEIALNGGFTLLTWFWIGHWTGMGLVFARLGLSAMRTIAVCIAAAVLIYMIHGGNFLVRGVLKKAGGLPDDAAPGFASREGYAHGRMIGYVERLIVVLVVTLGNLQALAFFFAAKGLIRSKELEDRRNADYFLLGSLVSFLIALSAGLILRKVFGVTWK